MTKRFWARLYLKRRGHSAKADRLTSPWAAARNPLISCPPEILREVYCLFSQFLDRNIGWAVKLLADIDHLPA
jgi:hypothetical protein